MSLPETCASCGENVVESALMRLQAGGGLPHLPGSPSDVKPLVTYITDHHHRYVHDVLPVLSAMLRQLVDAHGDRHPELGTILDGLRELGCDLVHHLAKEEHLLFPAIIGLAEARAANEAPAESAFSTLYHPIRAMEVEHDRLNRLLVRLRQLADNYTPPPDACATWRVCFVGLEQFESDLHTHLHIESYVLFPRALELERLLS